MRLVLGLCMGLIVSGPAALGADAPGRLAALTCQLIQDDAGARASIYIDLVNLRINISGLSTRRTNSFAVSERSLRFSNKGLNFSGQGVQYYFGHRYVANVLLEKADPFNGGFEGTIQLGDAFDGYQDPATPEFEIGKYATYRLRACRES